MPQWIHDRAEHISAKNPDMPKGQAFAIATQQAHAAGKSPKSYGTAEGKREAKVKYDKKTANPGGLDSAKIAAAAFFDELLKIGFMSDGGYLLDQIGKSKVRKQSSEPPDPALKVKEGAEDKLPVPGVDQKPGMCGPASLKAVLAYYGVDAEMKDLADIAESDEGKGTTAKGLVHAAELYGMSARIEDDSNFQRLESLLAQGVPPIIDWWYETEGHYSVVAGINDTEISLMDPEDGKTKWVTKEEFEPIWFDFEASDTEHKNPINKRIIVVRPRSDEDKPSAVKEGMIPTSPTPMGSTGMQAQKSLMKSQQVGTDDKNSIDFKPLNQANKGPKVPGVPNSSGSAAGVSGVKMSAANMVGWVKRAFGDSGFGPTGGVFRPQYASYQGQAPIPSPVMMDPNIKQGGNATPRKKLAFEQSGFGDATSIAAYGGNGGYHESYQGQMPLPQVVMMDPRIKRAGNAPLQKKAGIPLTPKGRLSAASREGKPKTTGFAGPSVADTAKPVGYGRTLPGAAKEGI